MKFTEDVIKSCRMCAVFLDEPACSVFNLALDEIERLQARVQELEAERKVYCTADGDYPAIGLMTIFEDYAETYIGGFDDGYWFDQNKGQLEDTVGEVYWKPLISLESQYAKQESEGEGE